MEFLTSIGPWSCGTFIDSRRLTKATPTKDFPVPGGPCTHECHVPIKVMIKKEKRLLYTKVFATPGSLECNFLLLQGNLNVANFYCFDKTNQMAELEN